MERNDSNYNDVVAAVAERIREAALMTDDQKHEYMANAKDVSAIALWETRSNIIRRHTPKRLTK